MTVRRTPNQKVRSDRKTDDLISYIFDKMKESDAAWHAALPPKIQQTGEKMRAQRGR
jgi:hypothetical protein